MLILFFPVFCFSQKKWTAYEQDISFKIKNAGITVTGRFTGMKTDLMFSPDKLSGSKLKGKAEVATIKTGINKRDEDLLGEKYFDTARYKYIEIVSTKLYAKDANYAGLFNVTIKGVTKQVEIPFEFNQLGDETEFKGSFNLKRSDFGIGGKTLTMSDDLVVTIVIKAKS